MTTIADDPAASLIDPPKTAAAAVSYLRVSTREQAEKGDDNGARGGSRGSDWRGHGRVPERTEPP